jgi:deoxyribonuclease-4
VILGAHVSIAGGIQNAVINAENIGCETFQIFTKNQNQWKDKTFKPSEINSFKRQLISSNQAKDQLACHDSYLINLCSPDSEMLNKSRQSFLNEVNRCDALGISFLVFHPGSHLGKGEEWGLKRISESLVWTIESSPQSKVKLLLETTAGQGTNLGYTVAHLKKIIELVNIPERLGICVDTCHMFAAGYDLREKKGYDETMDLIENEIGLHNLCLFHLNDSKKESGSRVDRHEVIGKGFIGEDFFRIVVNDERFSNVPGILEIPGGDDMFRLCLEQIKNFRIGG